MNTWGKIKFGKLYAIVSRNGVSKPSKIRGSGYPMINMGEIFRYDRINDSVKMELVPLDEKEKSNSFIKTGDLLFARQSLVVEGAGKCSIYIGVKADITFESHLIRVRLDNHLADPKYYYYYFSSYIGKSKIRSLVNQVAAAGIRGSELEKLEVDYPNLPTQSLIASVLSAYDDLIENNEKRIKAMEEMAQLLYTEWFVKFKFPGHEKTPLVDRGTECGMIPEGWEVKNFYDIVYNFDSKRKPLSSMKRQEMQGLYPYYGAAKIIDRINNYIFDGRYLLIAEDGSVITTDGRPVLQLVDEKFWVSNHAHVIQGKLISTELLYLRMNSYQIRQLITGAAQPKITKENLSRVTFLIPKGDLLQFFEEKIKILFDEIFSLKKKVENLSKMRDLLIPQLITGKRLLNN